MAQRFNVGYRVQGCLSPEGTAEIARIESAVPSGPILSRCLYPTLKRVETLGYCRMSLRDRSFAFSHMRLPRQMLVALPEDGRTPTPSALKAPLQAISNCIAPPLQLKG